MAVRLVSILGMFVASMGGTVRTAEGQDRKNVVVFQVGPSWPSGGTLALKGWVEGVEYRRQIRSGLDASLNWGTVFEWDGRGPSSAAGSLYHLGVHSVRRSDRNRVYYGGGPSIARYAGQVGVFGASCPTCGRRSGAGVFGVAGVERRIGTKLASVDGVLAVEGTVDRVWTSGIVADRPRRTGDTWTTVRFNLGFAW